MDTNRYRHINDGELLEKFYETKDNQWLGMLFQRYTLLLLGVCMKYLKNEEEARDCVQQVFLKAITELHKYEVEYFKSWLYTIARNHCLMRLRDRQGKIPRELNESLPVAAEEIDTKGLEEKENLFDNIELALEELNEDQKTCVTLFYLQKKSYQQIVDTTNYTLLQVKSHIQNGKRNLKLLVEKKLKKV
ncbi:sigma-70 family RNA polymerase sigma factor [Danxiaibacter flavus]|uniref:Sigma-70 family RNA polymerase sigma factor n=1 Tax=Danxiaibacter flavus TaxID=3049108 RepID=A0ABV3ZL82_9BACT|nr:sigma-70 family RNA polymerase sigma factor [Chitinophagaceae bacterium DXS]